MLEDLLKAMMELMVDLVRVSATEIVKGAERSYEESGEKIGRSFKQYTGEK